MTAATITTSDAADRAAYLADVPRTGRTVRIHLDGAKPRTVATYVLPRDLGRWGLIDLDGRHLVVDAADLDELLDEVIYAHGDLVDVDGKPKNSGPQTSLVALVHLIGRTARCV